MTADGVVTHSTTRPRRAKTWWRGPLLVLPAALAALIVYALVGYLIAPTLLERDVRRFVAARTARALQIERVSVDPFRLQLQLEGVALAQAPKAPAVAANLVTVALAPRSLMPGRTVFRRVAVQGPRVKWPAAVAPIGDRLVSPGEVLKAWLPEADVQLLEVDGGELQIGATANADRALPPLHVRGVSLRLRDWQQAGVAPAGGASFDLGAVVEGAELSASGTLAADAARLTADLTLGELDASPWGALLTVSPSLHVESATVSGSGRLDWSAAGVVWEGSPVVSGLRVVEREVGAPVLRVQRLLASELRVGRGGVLAWGALRAQSPRITLGRAASGQLGAGGELFGDVLWPRQGRVLPARLDVVDGQFSWIDASLRPIVRLEVEAVEGVGRFGPSASSEAGPVLSLAGVFEGADARLDANRARAEGEGLAFSLSLIDLPLERLSPYFAKLTSREIEAGTLTSQLYWTMATTPQPDGAGSAAVTSAGDQQFAAGGLRLAASPEGQASLPLDLYLALLEDEQGVAEARVRLADDRQGGASSLGEWIEMLGSEFLRQVDDLASAPFEALALAVTDETSAPEPLGSVSFDVGRAALRPANESRLATLAQALLQRPRLVLEIMPPIDPQADRAALAWEQMRLHVALATSVGAFGQAASGPPDFADGKVRRVIDEFASERLPSGDVARIAADQASGDDAYYAALFEALVANEPVTSAAMRRLARYRARAVRSELVRRGLAAERMVVSDTVVEADAAEGRVPMPLALRVLAVPSPVVD